jgi:hypothetical protein
MNSLYIPGDTMKYCLWGHRPGYVQVGSDIDRALQRHKGAVVSMQLAIGSALAPVLQRVAADLSWIIRTGY